ncbi:MAG: metal ABC transporter substrate-binding protein [Euryarchaeota archaeon]|nr:metal ABC transporter substrate-binding protein [Euryarchaeota archaeon]
MKHNIKRKYVLLLTGLLVVLSCCMVPSKAAQNTTIICTNSILADFASNLVTENVTIEYIMPAGACPTHFDTTPSDVSKIVSADIIISLGLEPWLDSLMKSSGNTHAQQINCAGLGEWNIPSGAKKHVEKIRDELSLLLPTLNETIQKNAENYMAQIDETAQQLRENITSNGYQGKQIICMQWQQDFLEWLGCNVTSSYGPPEGLSTQDMLNLSNAASSEEICAIVDNLQSGTDFGARIASESGASHVIFTNFPGAVPGTDTYLQMISYNTEQLISGIATFEYKQGEIATLGQKVSSLELERNISLLVVVILGISVFILLLLYKKK